MNQPTIEDIAAMREDGSLREYFQYLTGRPAPAKSKPAPLAVAPDPGYQVAHTGGWPIGSTATGPTPTHGRCTCPKCEQAAVVQMLRPHQMPDAGAA
ncbi:hypothetical protein [Streptomyces sp. AC555_RSS877]|uniref:hypothetical protein n=1 Tax=Streptomyces sp. AC555_RSS877 TaxID=2823688 RepID=UPI001C261D6B|nr:hypothetical protein [Streptomyces sp. AC555_RSS877]